MTASLSPHFSIFNFFADVRRIAFLVIAFEVHADASISIFEGESIHDHDEDEEDWKRNSNPDDVRGRVDTFPHDEIDDDPDSQSSEVDFPSEDSRICNYVFSIHVGTIIILDLHNVFEEHSAYKISMIFSQPKFVV